MRVKVTGLRSGQFRDVIVVVAALTVFRLVLLSYLDLVPDEAYYWMWSRVPSAGYYDHPPMIAWWLWASTGLVGDTPFGVRLLPILSVFVTSLAVYATVVELYDDRRMARLAAVWLNAMLLVGLGVVFATPDAPSVMFWALAMWTLARLRRGHSPALWVLVGVLAGLGCVSKYTNFFLGIGIVIWLCLDPVARRWRYSPWVLAGGAAAFVTFLPVLLWNAHHGWMSFEKQFGRLTSPGAENSHMAEFIAGQFGLINPVIAILAGVAFQRFVSQRKTFASSPLTFLVMLNFPLPAYLLFHSTYDAIHQNWAAPAYPALSILAAFAVCHQSGTVWASRLSRWVAPVGIALPCLVLVIFATPLARFIRFGTPADTVLGWRELYADVDGIRREKGAAWIATTEYGLTGELAFAAAGAVPVEQIVDRQRYLFRSPDAALLDRPGLLVVSAGEFSTARLAQCFTRWSPVETLHRETQGRPIELYFVVKVMGPAPDLFSAGCHSWASIPPPRD